MIGGYLEMAVVNLALRCKKKGEKGKRRSSFWKSQIPKTKISPLLSSNYIGFSIKFTNYSYPKPRMIRSSWRMKNVYQIELKMCKNMT